MKAALCFEDGELNFVFIDGEYSYEADKADIETWWPKVRSGELFIGHDYNRQLFPGVCWAVCEFGGEGYRNSSVSGAWWNPPFANGLCFDYQRSAYAT